MARPTKLNKTLQSKLVKVLKTGATVADACQHVGIHKDTFYDWLKRGEAGEAEFSDFSDAVSRAFGNAKVVAIGTLRNAMTPYKQTSTTVETFTETKLDRSGKPYEYKRQTERKSVTVMAGDWRAAVEYLKRRFADEWGDRQKIEDWRDQAIADLRDGKFTFDALADAFGGREGLIEAFGGISLAARLFAAAGIPVQVGESADASEADGG